MLNERLPNIIKFHVWTMGFKWILTMDRILTLILRMGIASRQWMRCLFSWILSKAMIGSLRVNYAFHLVPLTAQGFVGGG